MNILIVGSSGYLGGAITALAIEEQHNIRAYDLSAYADICPVFMECIQGDIRDYDRLKPHLDWAEAVIWSAAVVGAPASEINPQITKEVNQDSVKWLSENYDGRIIFTSTCSVYGDQESEVDEESEVKPLSPYSATKLAAESYLENKDAITFRIGTLYGVGDRVERVGFDLIVNYLVKKALTEGEISVPQKKQYRPLLHVKDAARIILDSVKTEHTGIYNLHSRNTLISELAGEIKECIPEVVVNTIDGEFEDSRNYMVNAQKAYVVLSFKPSYTVRDGIEELRGTA